MSNKPRPDEDDDATLVRRIIRDRRTSDDRLAHISMMNVKVDRRHDRRALMPGEFSRLVEAAKVGPVIESVPGPDRAMM